MNLALATMFQGEGAESAFLSLPPDVLYDILSYCDVRSLGRLSRTCHKLNDIINEEYLWIPRCKHVVACNQRSSSFLNRSCVNLTAKEKCRISTNWYRGRCKERALLTHRTSYMPWLQLEHDSLWYSKGNVILCYSRFTDGTISKVPKHVLRGHVEDVCKFVSKDGLVVSGGRDGAILGWDHDTGRFLFCHRHSHNSDINSVDCWKNIIVSGSRDKTAKIWVHQNNSTQCQHSINMLDRVWTVAITSCGRSMLCGSAGYNSVPPLQMYDLEMGKRVCTLGSDYRNGAGVLQVYPESANELLSCGYDTSVRLWDTRFGPKCIAQWEDPHDSVVYCMASDHHVTVLSGTSRHGLVRVWDKRMTKCLQMFYVGRGNSPVYSVTFDPYHMYVALDRSLNILDFSGDYSC